MRYRITPDQVTRAFEALVGGHGIEEAAASAGVHVTAVAMWMGRGPSVAAPGLPRHVPLIVAVDRARRGVSITDPLSTAEVVVASRLMLASIERAGAIFERIAAQLYQSVEIP